MGRPGANPEDLPNRVREHRIAKGMTLKQLAEAVGKGDRHQTIEKIETGKTELSPAWRKQLGRALGVRPLDLLRPEDAISLQVPIVGYIGAGEEVHYFDDQGHLDRTEPPSAEAEDAVAVIVRGTSMLPRYYEGDLLFFEKTADGVASDCLARDCIVKVHGGGLLVKRLFKGSAEGLYRLRSVNGPEIEDVELEWAAKVLFSKQA